MSSVHKCKRKIKPWSKDDCDCGHNIEEHWCELEPPPNTGCDLCECMKDSADVYYYLYPHMKIDIKVIP